MKPFPLPSVLRCIAYIGSAAITLVSVICLGVFLVLTSQTGLTFLEHTLNTVQSTANIKGLQGSLLGRFSLDQITLTDTNGTWFTLTDADCQWTPRHLFTGELEISFVRISKIYCTRIPAGTSKDAPPNTQASTSTSSDLPFLPSLVLQKFHISHLLIGADPKRPIPPLTLACSATIDPRSKQGEIKLHLHALNNGTPSLEMIASMQKDILECSGNFDDPQGDMVAFLGGDPQPLPLTISFQGSGNKNSYQGTIGAKAPALASLNTRLKWTTSEHKGSMHGTLSLEPEGKLHPLTDLLGEKIAIDLEASTDKEGKLVTSVLDLSSRRITLSTSGSLDLEKTTTNTQFTLTHTDPNRLTAPLGIVLEKLAPLTGSIQGNLTRPVLSCSLSAGSLQSGTTLVEHPTITLNAVPSPDTTHLLYSATLRTTTDNVRVPDILHTGPIHLQILADNLGGDVILARVKTSSNHFSLDGSGSFAQGTGILSATFGGNTRPEGLFSQDIGPLPESIALSGKIHGDLHALTGSADVQTQVGKFTKGPAPLDALLGPSSTLTLAAQIEGNDLHIESLTLNGTNVTAQGNGTLILGSDNDFQANLSGKILTPALGEDLAHLKELSLTSQAAGNREHISCAISAYPGESPVFGLPLTSVALQGTLKNLKTAPFGIWNVNVGTTSGPFDLAGDLDLKNGLTIPHATFQGLDLKGTFRLDLPADTPQTIVHFGIQSPSLTSVGTFAGKHLQGSVDMNGSYTDTQGVALLNLAGSAHDLNYEDSVTLGTLDLTQLNIDPSHPEQPELDLTINHLASDSLLLDTVNLHTTRQGNTLHFVTDLQGTQPAPLNLSLSGHTTSNFENLSLRLMTLEGEYNAFPIKLTAPATFHSSNNLLELSPLTLALGDGILRAQGYKNNDTLNATMALENITLESLQLLVPFSLPSGILTAHGSIRGPLEQPELQTDLVIANLTPSHSQPSDTPFSGTLTLAATTQNRILMSTGSLEGLGEKPFELTGKIPLALSLRPFHCSVSETTPIQAMAQGRIDLADLDDFFALPGLNLTGILQLDASATGTIAAPKLAGTIQLDQGRAEYVQTGTLLEQIHTMIRLDSNRVILETFSATDGEKGKLDAQGSVTLPLHAPLEYDLSAKLDTTRLISTDTLTAHVNGTCRVHGNPEHTSIQGDLTIPKAIVDISHNPDPNLVPVKVEEINVQPEHRITTEAKTSPPTNVTLNMTVTVPGQLFVRGRGLESEWKGVVKVEGTTAAPVITGTLKSIRGSLAFAGQNLALDEGKIQFDGAFPPNPLLNITTSTDIESTEIQVKMQGSANKPDLILDASPTLPEDEILALLLFGSSTSQLNPMQALQLANTARTLAGSSGKGGFDPMAFTRSVLGVDTINIGSDDDNEGLQVGIGKYLTDSIYLEVEKGLTSDDNAVSVEMALTPNIGVETEVGTDSTGKAGIYWKRDY